MMVCGWWLWFVVGGSVVKGCGLREGGREGEAEVREGGRGGGEGGREGGWGTSGPVWVLST
jgi:hypothetical protein